MSLSDIHNDDGIVRITAKRRPWLKDVERSCGTELVPLGEGGGTVQLKIFAAIEMGPPTEHKQQRFKSPGSAQRFLNVHAAVYNLFNIDRHLISRRTIKEFQSQAFRQWRDLTAAA